MPPIPPETWAHGAWCNLDLLRVQCRVSSFYGRKSRHGKNQSHVAWMAGGGGLYIFMSDSPHNWQHIHLLPEN